MNVPADTLAVFAILFAVGLGIRGALRSWVAPPAFCAAYWIAFVAINLSFPEYPLLPGGLLYLALVLAVFALSHHFFNETLLVRPTRRWPEFRVKRKLAPYLFRLALGTHLIAGLTYVEILRRMGVQQVENIGWGIQLLLISHFLGPLVVGILLGSGMLHRLDRLLSVLVLAPALAIAILYTGRTAFIGPAVIFATGFLAGTIVRQPRKTPLFSAFRILLVGAAFAATVAFGTAIYVLRIARGAEGSLDTVKPAQIVNALKSSRWESSYQSIRTSIFGQPSAFMFMLRDHYASPEFQRYHGRFMFAGPLVLLGHERPPHASYVSPDGIDTNVYTIFAPPIEDFGIAGSFGWWGLLGGLSAVAWRMARAGMLTGAAIIAILLINFQIGSCFLFRYNSVIGAYVLAIGCCVWLDRRRPPANGGARAPAALPASPSSTPRTNPLPCSVS